MVQNDINRRAPSQSKLLGACQGLSDVSGINANVLRVGTLVLLCMWFKLTVIAYCAAAVAFRLRQR